MAPGLQKEMVAAVEMAGLLRKDARRSGFMPSGCPRPRTMAKSLAAWRLPLRFAA
jgi:hypothetical protein